MTRRELEVLVEKRKQLLSIPYEKDSGYYECKKYALNNPVNTIEDFIKIDIWTYLKCMYYIMCNERDFEKISDNFDAFSGFFEIMNIKELSGFVSMCNATYELNNVEATIQFLKDSNIVQSVIDEYCNQNRIFDDDIFKQITGNNPKDINITKFYESFQNLGEPFLKLLALYKAYRDMVVDNEIFEDESKDINLRKKTKDKIRQDMYKELYKVKELVCEANRIRNYVSMIDKEEKQHARSNKKEIDNLDNAIALLDKALEKEEVTNAREIVKNIKSVTIKHAILSLIRDHNNKYYEKLDRELNNLNKNNTVKYQALLSDYGINKNLYQVNSFIHNSLEDTEQILKIITKIGFSDKEVINILINSNLEIVERIKEYIDKGYLSIEIINNNIDIFYKDSLKYARYNDCLELLGKYNINPGLFCDNEFILFIDSNLLASNLDLLDKYNYINSLKNTDNYSFLSNNELYLIIDKLIELGYEKYLEEDLNIFNSDKLKRLEALKAMSIPVDDSEELDRILNKKFFISDRELDDIIPIKVPLNKNVSLDVNELNNYRENARLYNIDGVLISFNKVMRLLNEGYSLHDALFFNMNLTYDEYINIIKKLKGREYTK